MRLVTGKWERNDWKQENGKNTTVKKKKMCRK